LKQPGIAHEINTPIQYIVGAVKEFSHPGSTDKVLTDIHKSIENTMTVARSEGLAKG